MTETATTTEATVDPEPVEREFPLHPVFEETLAASPKARDYYEHRDEFLSHEDYRRPETDPLAAVVADARAAQEAHLKYLLPAGTAEYVAALHRGEGQTVDGGYPATLEPLPEEAAMARVQADARQRLLDHGAREEDFPLDHGPDDAA